MPLKTQWKRCQANAPVFTLTGKVHSTTSGHIENSWGAFKKIQHHQKYPKKPVAYVYIQLFNPSQNKEAAQEAAGNVWTTTTWQDKSKITELHSLNTCWVTTTKQQRPCTMHAGLSASENSPTKMGRQRVKFIFHAQNGRTKRSGLNHKEGIFFLKKMYHSKYKQSLKLLHKSRIR